MADLEKVIKGLEICSAGKWNSSGGRDHTSCPYYPAGYTGCTGKLLMRDALELLKEQEWISVNDRLPDNKSRYLCACFDYVTKTYWIDVLWRVSGSWWARLSTMGTDKDYNDHVRYWMPLPEPPKEGDRE